MSGLLHVEGTGEGTFSPAPYERPKLPGHAVVQARMLEKQHSIHPEVSGIPYSDDPALAGSSLGWGAWSEVS